MNFHNKIHHLYPFFGTYHLLHLLENNQLNNLLLIKWNYHLLIQLLEKTDQIQDTNLVFQIDIITSNSWLAIIQNAYYWKEMNQIIHLQKELEKNLHPLSLVLASGCHHDSNQEKCFLNFKIEHLINIDQLQSNKDDLLKFQLVESYQTILVETNHQSR